MKKVNIDSDNDIVEEPYKGTSPVVASAGYVYITHWIGIIIGAATLGILGMVASNKTIAIKDAFTQFGKTHANSANSLNKSAAWLVGGIPKMADYFATKFVAAIEKLGGKNIAKVDTTSQKTAAVMFAGGLGAAFGWVGSTIWGIVKGGHEGNTGKRQFERAKAEIKELRERNDDLGKINEDLHKKYVEAATHLDTMEAQPAAAPEATKHPTNSTLDSPPDTLPAHAKAEHPTHPAPHEHAPHAPHHDKADAPSHHIQAGGHHGHEHHGKLHAHAAHEHAAHATA